MGRQTLCDITYAICAKLGLAHGFMCWNEHITVLLLRILLDGFSRYLWERFFMIPGHNSFRFYLVARAFAEKLNKPDLLTRSWYCSAQKFAAQCRFTKLGIYCIGRRKHKACSPQWMRSKLSILLNHNGGQDISSRFGFLTVIWRKIASRRSISVI